LRTSRKILGLPVPAAIAGGLVLVGGGVALAAILLTTNITGTAKVNTVGTSNAITVVPSVSNGSALNCSDLKVSPDFKTLTFNPVLTKTINGSNSGTDPVKGGDCTITLNVKNTGTSTIKVDGSSGFTVPNEGWEITALTGDALNPIQPGTTASVSATLKATEAAKDGGTFGGKLVYTDAA
jgi:hypothetical protein